jgi:hypothetical protein
MPIGPPGNAGIDVLVNCLRLHTAMGEQARVAGCSVVLEDATRRARRGKLRRAVDTSMAATANGRSSIGRWVGRLAAS